MIFWENVDDKTAIIDDMGRKYSYSDLDIAVTKVSRKLQGCQLALIEMDNSLESLIFYLSCLYVDMPVIIVNKGIGSYELLQYIQKYSIDLIYISNDSATDSLLETEYDIKCRIRKCLLYMRKKLSKKDIYCQLLLLLPTSGTCKVSKLVRISRENLLDIVLLFFILILVKGLWKPVSPGEQLTLGSTEEYMADYYEEWTGPLNEEVFKDIESRSKQLELLIDDNNPAAGYYANGLKAIGERIEYIRANSNRNLWLVNPSGYEYMIGDKGRGISEMSFLIALVGLATIIASVFSYEKKSDMEVLINTTGNGRKSVKKRKYIIVVILCIIMWLIISGMEIYTVTKTYKLSGLQAPVQSLSFMENIPINISIGGYMCIAYIYRLIVMLLSETIFIVVSEKVNNQEVCLLLCGVVILPAVLSIIGMDYLSVISVTHWIRLI